MVLLHPSRLHHHRLLLPAPLLLAVILCAVPFSSSFLLLPPRSASSSSPPSSSLAPPRGRYHHHHHHHSRRSSPLPLAAAATTTTNPLPRNNTTSSPPSPSPLREEAPGDYPGWPVVGNIFDAARQGADLAAYFSDLKRRHGGIATCQLLGRKMYVVSTPELAREVFVSRVKEMEDRFVFPGFKEVLGDNKGIIFANGHEAALNRRLSMPAFHRADILEKALQVVIQSAEFVASGYASLPVGSVEAGLHDAMKRLSLGVVAQACFSIPVGMVQDPQSRYAGLDGMIKENFRLMGATLRFPIPFAHKWGLNPVLRSFRDSWEELSRVQDGIIEERRREREGGGGRRESVDLLDVYLEALEVGEEGDEEEDAISNQSIRKNIHDIFIAGSDTTAGTITASLYEIHRNPAVLSRVMEELTGFDWDDPQQVTVAGMQQRLPYLSCCIKESLRLYPAASSVLRVVGGKDTCLGGYRVQQGSLVAVSIKDIHRDRRVWGEDAEVYRPERWEGGGEERDSYAYIPFGAGPRICLGMRFAVMEVLAVLAVMLRRVDMTPVDGEAPLRVSWPTTIAFEGGVPMVMRGARKGV